MQFFAHQVSALLFEIKQNPTKRSELLISNIRTLGEALKGATNFNGAMQLFRRRKEWLSVVEEVAPYTFASQCNKKIKFMFWLVTTPIARSFVIALLFLPIAVFLLPSFVTYSARSVLSYLRRMSRGQGKRDEYVFYCASHEREVKEDELTHIRTAVASNSNTRPETLALLAKDDEQIVRRSVAKNVSAPQEVLELLAHEEQEGVNRVLTNGIKVNTNKGMLFMLSGYKSNSLYPFKQFLAEEGLDDQDFVIFTNHPNLAVVFQDTNARYPLYSIHGSSVVDKNKEIEIYTEIYDKFKNIDESISKIKYKGIPVASFMLTNFFTSAAIASAAGEAYEYCRSINRKNVIFITRGADVFLDSVLRDMCRNNENELNEFHAWRVLPIYDPYEQVQIVYENPVGHSRFKPFGFHTVNARSKNVWTEARGEAVRKRIERILTRPGLFKSTRALIHELYRPYYFASASIRYYGKRSEADPVFVVTEADPNSIYWKAIYPVIKSVRAKGGKVVVFTGNYSAFAKLRSESIEAFLLSANIRIPQKLELNKETNRIYMELSSYIKFIMIPEEKKKYKYFGQKDMYVMFNGIKDNRGLYSGFRHSMMLIDMLDEAFDAYKPRSVLAMPHASPGPAHAIDIARARGVTSVTMPAVTVDSNRRSIPINWKTDIIASYGTQCSSAFIETGHNKETLILTGNASLDTLVRREVEATEDEVYSRLGIDKKMKIVLVATSRIDAREDIWLNEMHDYCEGRGDAIVVIKSHPSFDPSTYSKVRKGKHCVVLDDIPIYSLIFSSSVVVTDYSTTGAEAALVDKPVIVVNLLGKEFPSNNYDQLGVALLIDDLSKVVPALDSILDDDEKVRAKMKRARVQFAKDYNFKNDGQAADRIADILLNPDQYSSRA